MTVRRDAGPEAHALLALFIISCYYIAYIDNCNIHTAYEVLH